MPHSDTDAGRALYVSGEDPGGRSGGVDWESGYGVPAAPAVPVAASLRTASSRLDSFERQR
jgi:hypothetical protein